LPDVAVIDGDDAVPDTMTILVEMDTAEEGKNVGTTVECELPRIGSMLGKYLLTEFVGQGASGVVYRALHPTLHIPVAIKVLHRTGAGVGSDRPCPLEAEAQVLAMLNHPNVVRVYDFEAHARHPFLVLEHVNGPSLAELIDQCGRLQPHRALKIGRQLADALSVAHRLGIVHRDVKPGNVLLTRSGDVKLADLGLASIMDPIGNGASITGGRAGTASYVAPEVIKTGDALDRRSDIYSLGATLFHALTGVAPFRGGSPWHVIEQQIKSPPPCPRTLVPDLPEDLSDLVARMMAKDPADRPSDFDDLLHDPEMDISSGYERMPPGRRQYAMSAC
jgi:serine/threonine protein kinase